MLIKHECYKARSEITAFSVLNNDSIAFSTAMHGAKIFSHQRCSAIKNLTLESLGHNTTAVSFSKDEELIAFANNNIIYIVQTHDKLLLQKIHTYEGTITLLEFVPNSKYIITGTKDGRVMQYRYDGRSGLSRLCSFGQAKEGRETALKNNYVSAFTFYNNTLACSGYGGDITIVKLPSRSSKYTFNASKFRINALCFLTNDTLLSGGNDGILQIHSLKQKKVLKKITTPFQKISSILIMPNPQYVMLSSDSKNLCIIDLENAKLVSSAYLSFKDNVSKIALTKENNLLVVLHSKQFYKVVLPTAQHIKDFILNGELDKAYRLIEKDPMLKGTREHKRVEVLYDKLYAQAIDALINSNTKEARNLMKKFNDIPSKKDDINSIFKAFEYYPRFVNLYLEKKHALAYALCEKYPALKHTKQYKKMEEIFKNDYAFAQKQILIGREDVAKEILSTYITVLSKKPMLNLLLKQNKDFIRFLKAINEQDFATIEKLIKNNEVFTQIPSYTAMLESTQKALLSIESFINKGLADEAIAQIKLHLKTSSIKNELQELYRDAKLLKQLQESYKQNDFKSCYEIIDSAHNLHALELTILLEDHWSKLMQECESYAFKGDFKSIKKRLGSLIRVKTRTEKVGDILRLSFYTKTKAFMAKRSFKNAENVIYTYIDTFGIDSEILLLMKTYEKASKQKLAITLNQDTRKARDAWLNAFIIN